VYAITRRGYGASSQPASGYDEQRLADDVLRVLDALHIEAPVLVGHSMAGGELTTLGGQHSSRLGGLVYLSALGDPTDWPASDPAYMELFRALPAPMQRHGTACTQDRRSFSGYRAWQMCAERFAFPESELRSVYTTNSDGTRGAHKTPRSVHEAIGAGARKRDYSGIRVPVLAVSEAPADLPDPDAYKPQNEQERAAVAAFDRATKVYVDRAIANFKRGVPDARLVDLAGAGHYLFLKQEAGVLRELRAFVAGLPVTPARNAGTSPSPPPPQPDRPRP
jgi:pimeloyl-ACP methyl ester carboxylesterase